MQTGLLQELLATAHGREADEILRNCVHCGFCNATCPTYQLTGNELDGPRGRIYLVKQMLEGRTASASTRLHLDRCLVCRACETTCPSGVDYHRLLDIGRMQLETEARRSAPARLLRYLLRTILAHERRFRTLLRTAQLIRPLLPAVLKKRIPPRRRSSPHLPRRRHGRSVLMPAGCVQPGIAPQINNAATRVLDTLGINVVDEHGDGCCGALSHHLAAADEAGAFMRRNIDAWWPHIERGAEAIVVTASGCAPMVKEYGRLLADDFRYARKAGRVSELAMDLSEYIQAQPLDGKFGQPAAATAVAFHSPCTLQHAQRINGVVEDILQRLGYRLTAVADGHLCCGSAGTYSILQPELSKRLRVHKLAALQAGTPDLIATANIGCYTHMQNHADVPVLHWIELLATLIPDPAP